jgi:hypothetical protein
MAALFAKKLVRAGSSARFTSAARRRVGWEAASWRHQQIEMSKRHNDWHRVERVLGRFGREIAELHRQGWRETEVTA